MGVDKRDLGLDNVGTGGQSDADILLTINTKTGKAKAIAIPRDTMVDVDLYSESGIFLSSEKMQLCLSNAYGDGKAKSAENTANSISRGKTSSRMTCFSRMCAFDNAHSYFCGI